MSDRISQLQADLAKLEEEIRNDPRVIDAEHLRGVIAFYQRRSGSVQAGGGQQNQTADGSQADLRSANEKNPPINTSVELGKKNPNAKIYRFRVEAEKYLQQRGSAHRKEIAEYLTKVGAMGGEKNPVAAVATSMNVWKDVFVSDGRGNFRLRASEAGDGSAR